MKIPGQPQTPIPSRYKGKLQIRYRKDGTVIVGKWPRRRGPPKHPTTQAQVKLWDTAIELIKFADASEVAAAKTITNNTAYYARDILLSAAYGNFVSWPGFGIMPGGPGTDEVGAPVWGNLAPADRPPATARIVNNVTSFDTEHWTEPTMTVQVTTSLPAPNIKLWMSCVDYMLIPKDTRRGGQVVAHGKRQWAPSVCGQFDPSEISDNIALWNVTPCCDCGGTCFYWVGELDDDEDSLMWSSLIRQCPECHHAPPVTSTGTMTGIGWLLFPGFYARPQGHLTCTTTGPVIACFGQVWLVIASGQLNITYTGTMDATAFPDDSAQISVGPPDQPPGTQLFLGPIGTGPSANLGFNTGWFNFPGGVIGVNGIMLGGTHGFPGVAAGRTDILYRSHP